MKIILGKLQKPAIIFAFLLIFAGLAHVFSSPDISGEQPLHAKVVKILVRKEKRRMSLLDMEGNAIEEYNISLGAHPEGHKTQEGDEKTPEGNYFISAKNERSAFHKALKISYPNSKDVLQAQKRGVSPGGMIMIHGLPNGSGWLGRLHLLYNRWTDGCIAVTDKEIDQIWDLVPVGTPIEIRY